MKLLPDFLLANIPPEALQHVVRLTVIIATYMLFRPHIERLLKYVYGTPDASQSQMQARFAVMQDAEAEAKKNGSSSRSGTTRTAVLPPPIEERAKDLKDE